MEPSLKVGSILYYHKENKINFNKKDILVFKNKNHIVSHRIVEKLQEGFITKGDANEIIDASEIYNTQVLGKGTNWCIPYLGYYADFIYTHKYLLYISIIILIIDLYKEHRKKGNLNYEKSN